TRRAWLPGFIVRTIWRNARRHAGRDKREDVGADDEICAVVPAPRQNTDVGPRPRIVGLIATTPLCQLAHTTRVVAPGFGPEKSAVFVEERPNASRFQSLAFMGGCRRGRPSEVSPRCCEDSPGVPRVPPGPPRH